MTSDQYTELVGFLGRKFEGVDRRFEGIDRRFDDIDRRFDGVDEKIEESRRHARVLFEQSQANLQAVAEGLGLRIEQLTEAMRTGFADHERRIQVLEGARLKGGA